MEDDGIAKEAQLNRLTAIIDFTQSSLSFTWEKEALILWNLLQSLA